MVYGSRFTICSSRFTVHGSRFAEREREGREGKRRRGRERERERDTDTGERRGRGWARGERDIGRVGAHGKAESVGTDTRREGREEERRGEEGRGGQLKVQCSWFTSQV